MIATWLTALENPSRTAIAFAMGSRRAAFLFVVATCVAWFARCYVRCSGGTSRPPKSRLETATDVSLNSRATTVRPKEAMGFLDSRLHNWTDILCKPRGAVPDGANTEAVGNNEVQSASADFNEILDVLRAGNSVTDDECARNYFRETHVAFHREFG